MFLLHSLSNTPALSLSRKNQKTMLLPPPLFLFFLLLYFSAIVVITSLNQEGLYLQQVRLGLSDPTNSLSSWNARDDTPCNWSGVSCDSATQRVISVDLSNSQLGGPFPTFFCRLPSLSSLSLSNNIINSTLPADISTCHNLLVLDLSQNLVVGPIPQTLSRISTLRRLDLSGNNFTGEIPASFGEFQRLEYLNLVENLLNGTIPTSLGNISSLKELQLAYNPLSSSRIPSELGNLMNLEFLWLSDCNLIGQIPMSLGNLTRLKNLDLSMNKISGSIPSSLTQMKSLVQVELFHNSLSGEFPPLMSNLTSLRRFDSSMNELTGMISEDLCALPLESLNLYENRFEGVLPGSIADSPNLYGLKLFNNKLSGPLPSQLGRNSPLQWLDFSYNGFSGEIPEFLCSRGELQGLVLMHNSFSGKIPESLGKCSSLIRVRLRNNEFSGTVPEEFWGLPKLSVLDLVENSFAGSISSKITSAQNLSSLLISDNKISGPIPEEIGSLTNLFEFSGNDNNFTGKIPESLGNLSQLGKLDLNNNEISGELPRTIQNLKKLNELYLANNKLSGRIPNEIGSLAVLSYLDLSSNRLSGNIPLELQNLKLNFLNLSSNLFSGQIPPLYAKESYKVSFLDNPGLCGDIPGLCPSLGKTENNFYFWILWSIFILAGVVLFAGLVWFYWKYRNYKKNKKENSALSKWRSFHKVDFSESEIIGCLKEDNVIGEGASGKVYKVVLTNGDTVAVKKLWEVAKNESSFNSEKDGFEAEVETLGKIRHKNIVRLWCCCNAGDNCKLLVYEYMPNGSLGDLLHGVKSVLLDWPVRYKIAFDAAEGLSYLHHDCVPPVVHRDIKSNNILLDADFRARVSDFGVAKFVKGSNGAESMSVIAGSCGYIAPEYAYTLRVNEKSDIYSLGVVMLELVTGRRPNDPEFGWKDLVKWVHTTLDQKGPDHVIDPKLDSSYKEEIVRVLNIALICTSSLSMNRPSMRTVVKLLQEVTGLDIKSMAVKKDSQLSPCYHEDFSDKGGLV